MNIFTTVADDIEHLFEGDLSKLQTLFGHYGPALLSALKHDADSFVGGGVKLVAADAEIIIETVGRTVQSGLKDLAAGQSPGTAMKDVGTALAKVNWSTAGGHIVQYSETTLTTLATTLGQGVLSGVMSFL